MSDKIKIYFKEQQKLKNAWLWLAFFFVALLFFSYLLFRQLILLQPIGNKPISNSGLITFSILIPLIFLFVNYIYRKTILFIQISPEGIHLRYSPYFKEERVIYFNEIKKFYKRNYKPLREYGGHGVIKGKSKYGSAMTAFGNVGIQLELKSGKKILIGTQRAEYFLNELRKVMGRKE